MPTLQAQAVRRAIQICGGDLTLAARIGITVTKLNLMAEGLASVPADIFATVVDILTAHAVKTATRTCPPGVSDLDTDDPIAEH